MRVAFVTSVYRVGVHELLEEVVAVHAVLLRHKSFDGFAQTERDRERKRERALWQVGTCGKCSLLIILILYSNDDSWYDSLVVYVKYYHYYHWCEASGCVGWILLIGRKRERERDTESLVKWR